MFKLLIVDDEPLVAVGVKSLLDWSTLDIECIGTARNGEMALEMIRTNLPDLVISDIKMPLMDGISLAKACAEEFGKLPVFIMLTSYDDFAYVRQALQLHASDYLIKLELDEAILQTSVTKALDEIRQIKSISQEPESRPIDALHVLREKFFIRLLNNLFESRKTFDMQQNLLGIAFSASRYLAASLRLEASGSSTVTLDPGKQVDVYKGATNLIQETLRKSLRFYLVALDIWHYAIIFPIPEDAENFPEKTVLNLRRLGDALKNYMNIDLFAATGNIVTDISLIHSSYWLSQSLLQKTNAKEKILSFDDLEDFSADLPATATEICTNLRTAFEELDTVALNEALEALADLCRQKPNRFTEIAELANNVLYMARTLLPGGEDMVEEIFSDFPGGARALYIMHDTESIAAWIRHLREGCNTWLLSQRHNHSEHVVMEIKNYILNHLNQELSLNEVATVFNFNPNYLSQLFSKYSDIGFVDFITNSRVSQAKRMLNQGHKKIYEIAEELGFGNPFYFSKVFKKVEGVSPSEYVNKLEGKGESE